MEKIVSQSKIKKNKMLVNNKIGSRRLARKFIVQGIYQWLIASSQKEEIENFLSDQDSYVDCDDE